MWLVNTGWTGGPYGVGKRIDLRHTRAMLKAAPEGQLERVAFVTDPVFGVQVPQECPGVMAEVLQPRASGTIPRPTMRRLRSWLRCFVRSGRRYRLAARGLSAINFTCVFFAKPASVDMKRLTVSPFETIFEVTMKHESAVDFATNARIHIAIAVNNLQQSVDFYRTLFGQEPTKTRPQYAKFEVAEPPINLALNESNLPSARAMRSRTSAFRSSRRARWMK